MCPKLIYSANSDRKIPSVLSHSLRSLGLLASLLVTCGAYAADRDLTYVTRPGDTLIGLEREFLAAPFSWKNLQRYNHVFDTLRMPIGARLRIPEAWLRIEPRVAQVIALQGEVTMDGRALSLDAQVPAGALVRTGAGAFVTLVMPDESHLTVQPDSAAKLDHLNGVTGFPGQRAEVYVERGRVETKVRSQRGPAARYQIRTPTASVTVRGTEFRVGTDALAHTSQTEVTGGEVAFGQAGGATPTALPAGFGVVARAGEPVPTPRPLLPPPSVASMPARIEQVSFALPFSPVDQAAAYRVQIARDAEFNDVVTQGKFVTPPARFTDLPDGAYWLRVRAIDTVGLEGFDATHAFELRARPVAPVVRASSDGMLAWDTAPEAVRYRLQIATDDRFARPLVERDLAAQDTVPVLPPGRYVWRVASLRDNGARGPWGAAQPYVVQPIPGPVTLTTYNQRLRFAWPAEPARIYEVQVARDMDFTDLLVVQRTGEAAFTMPAPATGTYYLRLRASVPDGSASPWSGTQILSPVLLLPWWTLSAPAALVP